jgi:hypothetical protein
MRTRLVLAVCTCTPLLVALAAAFLTCVGGGYGIGSWGGKTFALMHDQDPGSAANVGGAIVGAVGAATWAGYALVVVVRWFA